MARKNHPRHPVRKILKRVCGNCLGRGVVGKNRDRCEVCNGTGAVPA